jgi:hypothetical protein
VFRSLILSAAKWVSALLLGGGILWQVADHCDATKARLILHVTKRNVDVTVDDATYRVETDWETPLVCELEPGRHTVRMLREGRVLYEEPFTVAPSEEVILTAWDGYRDGRCPGRDPDREGLEGDRGSDQDRHHGS